MFLRNFQIHPMAPGEGWDTVPSFSLHEAKESTTKQEISKPTINYSILSLSFPFSSQSTVEVVDPTTKI